MADIGAFRGRKCGKSGPIFRKIVALVVPRQAVLSAFVAVPAPIGPMPLRGGGPGGGAGAADAPWVAWRGACGATVVSEPRGEALQVRFRGVRRPCKTAREHGASRAVGVGVCSVRALAAAAAVVSAVLAVAAAVARAAVVVPVVAATVARTAFFVVRAVLPVARTAVGAASVAAAVAAFALAVLTRTFLLGSAVVVGFGRGPGPHAEAEDGGHGKCQQFLHVSRCLGG